MIFWQSEWFARFWFTNQSCSKNPIILFVEPLQLIYLWRKETDEEMILCFLFQNSLDEHRRFENGKPKFNFHWIERWNGLHQLFGYRRRHFEIWRNKIVKLQWAPLNRITLGQERFDSINWILQIDTIIRIFFQIPSLASFTIWT